FFAFFNSVKEQGVYTEQRGNVPPLVAVPSRDEEARLQQLTASIQAAESAVRSNEASLATQQADWERAQLAQPPGPEPAGLAVRLPLDGRLIVSTAKQQLQALGQPTWIEGP